RGAGPERAGEEDAGRRPRRAPGHDPAQPRPAGGRPDHRRGVQPAVPAGDLLPGPGFRPRRRSRRGAGTRAGGHRPDRAHLRARHDPPLRLAGMARDAAPGGGGEQGQPLPALRELIPVRTDVDRDTACPGPDPDPGPAMRFTVPPGAADIHAHVVGEEFVERRSYTPPPAPGREYLRMLDATGMTYGVLVQVSVHGADNSVMLGVLAAHRDRLRGVAVVAPDVCDTELGRLADAGVVGLRLN